MSTTLPSTAPKLFCFVLMPFEKEFDDIYQLGIKAACTEAGAYCERVDEQIFTSSILERVYNQIAKADLIIADMTGRNPNVFYEVGYAHALNKKAILITKNAEDIPFDLKHYPHIVYEGRIADLKETLTQRVKYFVENPELNEDSRIDLDLFLNDQLLGSNEIEIHMTGGWACILKLTIHNNSFRAVEGGTFQMSINCEDSTDFNLESAVQDEKLEIIRLPDKQKMYLLPYFDNLFPKGYTSFLVRLISHYTEGIGKARIGLFRPNSKISLTFRIATHNNYRDFKVGLIVEPPKKAAQQVSGATTPA